MPLRDHFHAPLFSTHPFESFHTVWSVTIMEALNRSLPRRFFATVSRHLGSSVEADVAEFEHTEEPGNGLLDEAEGGGAAVAVQPWAPPLATAVMPAVFPDDLEVEVLDMMNDARLVGVIELISPRNKDRPASRRAFAAKCMAYLQRGIGLVVVDTVTNRQFNLHDEMIRLMELEEAFLMSDAAYLYTVAYRPARRQETNQIDVWPHVLTVGGTLPLVPLALRGHRAVPLDLEVTYNDACQRSRL